MLVIWVFVAGGIGSAARYLVGQWAIQRFEPSFPYGTLAVNLAGCFAIGVAAQVATTSAWGPELRAAVFAGFLGGFTTYSSFNYETLTLLGHGAAGAALANVGVTLAGGLVAGWLGLAVARLFVP